MYWTIAAVLVALWVLINLKTSRGDGTLRRDVHPYRQIMQYVMPTRTESVVYFDEHIDAGNLQAYLSEAHDAFGAGMTQAIVGAAAITLFKNPKMRQFVSGRRLYQRNGVWLTFSMKRKKLDQRARLSVVKLEAQPTDTFRDLCARISDQINVERSDAKTYADKEYALFNRLPRPVLIIATRFLRWLDHHNLLPYEAFIKSDGMYTNMFIANLGSIGMNPGYHHLYEWGNCPLFMTVGRINEQPVARDGAVVVRPMLHIRYSYDERIDDGLTARHGLDCLRHVLEDPQRWLGCLAEDGSDTHPLIVPEQSP